MVAIGLCYGVQLTADEAWKLVKQFIIAGGLTFAAVNLGSKFIAAVLQTTGVGYIGGVAMDAAISAATAYAVGGAAKAYFKGEHDKEALGRIFRERFKSAKKDPNLTK